jgi:hypothetical protein
MAQELESPEVHSLTVPLCSALWTYDHCAPLRESSVWAVAIPPPSYEMMDNEEKDGLHLVLKREK